MNSKLTTPNPTESIQSTTSTRPIDIGQGLMVGSNEVITMTGPCSVESYEQMVQVAEATVAAGGRVIRGGAFKPRTSPYVFQGLGMEGLEILSVVAREYGLLTITEALGVEHVAAVADMADIIQIGSRNMQHLPLLWEVGQTDKPILLKRGFMSTIDEWRLAAAHISSRGNDRIILCERGIRTFETATRNTLDVNAIALVKQTLPYPVIADPSHGTGRRDLVTAAAMASIAAGADGLLVEFHPNPDKALSDREQSLPLDYLPAFRKQVGLITNALGRIIV